MKTVGVVLAGCGFLDGAEIYESVLTLLFLDRAGAAYQCLAPEVDQMHVVDHLAGKPTSESRKVLVEAARIARGKILPLDDSWVDKLDAVIFPGGFGAAKNYCDYAVKGDDCSISPVVESFMRKLVTAKKPIGLVCISPVVFARAMKGSGLSPTLTAGDPGSAADSIVYFGGKHSVCSATDCVVDRDHKIVSTPAYMLDTHIADAAKGIEKLVHEVLEFVR
jgi:enhancing lycopene biosynthesis protein 2